MRFAIIFLLVLVFAVLFSSLVSWGAMYSFACMCIVNMAADFNELATVAFQDVSNLLLHTTEEFAMVVADIIQVEFTASGACIDQTEDQLQGTTLSLMHSISNMTEQLHQQMHSFVMSFGANMHEVLADFQGISSHYAAELRREIVQKVDVKFASLVEERVMAIQHFAHLFGVLNLTLMVNQPIVSDSCLLLDLLCSAGTGLNDGFTAETGLFLGTAQGSLYSCTSSMLARILQSNEEGADCGKMLNWWAVSRAERSISGHAGWKERCMTESPRTTFLSGNCSNELCHTSRGFDPRCRPWYQAHSGLSPPLQVYMSTVYTDFNTKQPVVTLSFPSYLRNSDSSVDLVAVVAVDLHLQHIRHFLQSLPLPNDTHVAVVVNDTNLTVFASSFNQHYCQQDLMPFPLTKSCDSELASLGEWLLERRLYTAQHVFVELGDTLWDIFPSAAPSVTYFVLVGMARSAIFGTIDRTRQRTSEDLNAASFEQSSKVLAAGNQTFTYLQGLKESHLQELQQMRQLLQQDLNQRQSDSFALLNTSHKRSNQLVTNLTVRQQNHIVQLRFSNLQLLARTTKWTLGVVASVFLSVLLAGSLGTFSITRRLQELIVAMEDVAQMKVDTPFPHAKSGFTEVQRIQVAFRMMTERLREYRAFIPAGVFRANDSTLSDDGDAEVQQSAVVETNVDNQERLECQDLDNADFASVMAPSSSFIPLGTFSSLVTMNTADTCMQRRNIAVLVVNLVQFKAHLPSTSEVSLGIFFNKYITLVHCHISQAGGHIDAMIGDQVFTTFNAHLHCSDCAIAATNAASKLKTALPAQLGSNCHVQIGLAAGHVFAGSAGHSSFKTMITIGAPMKIASLLSHLTECPENSILADPILEERVKYTFALRPMDLVYLPQLGTFDANFLGSMTVYLVGSHKELADDEWLYQVNAGGCGDWDACFNKIISALTLEKAESTLQTHMSLHPGDQVAIRLQRRLTYWQPRRGLPLSEGVEYITDPSIPGTAFWLSAMRDQ